MQILNYLKKIAFLAVGASTLTGVALAAKAPYKLEIVESVSGMTEGELFIPMREILINLPTGFRFCAEGISPTTKFTFQPPQWGTPQFAFEGDCIIFNYLVLARDTRLSLFLGNGEVFQINLQPKSGFSYGSESLQVLRSDGEQFVTLTLNAKTTDLATEATICQNRLNPLVSAATRPYPTDNEFDELKLSRVASLREPLCTTFSGFRWNAGTWESYFEFANSLVIRFVESL